MKTNSVEMYYAFDKTKGGISYSVDHTNGIKILCSLVILARNQEKGEGILMSNMKKFENKFTGGNSETEILWFSLIRFFSIIKN